MSLLNPPSAADRLREEAASLAEQLSDDTAALTRRGINAVRRGSRRLRDEASRASHQAVDFVREDPVRSALIATVAIAGALAVYIALTRFLRDR